MVYQLICKGNIKNLKYCTSVFLFVQMIVEYTTSGLFQMNKHDKLVKAKLLK